jgi:hypothetical protein
VRDIGTDTKYQHSYYNTATDFAGTTRYIQQGCSSVYPARACYEFIVVLDHLGWQIGAIVWVSECKWAKQNLPHTACSLHEALHSLGANSTRGQLPGAPGQGLCQ